MLTHLFLMRHAKSSWDTPDLVDHQRPLNKRGRRAADLIGQTLHARGYAPQIIWSSDSTRTRQTAQRLVRAIPGPQSAFYTEALYHASAQNILRFMDKQGEPDCQRLMVLAHNPGMEELLEFISGQRRDVPTAATAVFKRIEGGAWLERESWQMIDYVLPRELDAQS